METASISNRSLKISADRAHQTPLIISPAASSKVQSVLAKVRHGVRRVAITAPFRATAKILAAARAYTPRMRASVLVLALLATGCKGALDLVTPTPDPPKSNAPASIKLSASTRPDYQTTVVATVYTVDKRGVPNIPIAFSTGAGTITSQQSATDSNGNATAIVNTPIATIVTAAASGMSGALEITGGAPPPTAGGLPPVIAPGTPDPGLPAAVMNVASTGTTGISLLFGVSAPGGQTWSWNFGDGNIVQTTAYTIGHTYTAAGTYSASVSSAGTKGAHAIVTISDAPPSAGSTPTLTATLACTPATHGSASVCNISSLAYGGTALQSGAITGVSWDWGDGTTSAGIVGSRTYPSAGTYNVFATVTANTVDGSKSTTTPKSIAVP